MIPNVVRNVAFILTTVLTSACSTLQYYHHSVSGHLSMMSKRQNISKLIVNQDSDSQLVKQLQIATAARDYATRVLALPDNDSYRSYVDLQRPYLSWALFAAPEFSIDSKRWCFLFVGCVPYRGYFKEAQAKAFGQQLVGEGYDVYIGGVPAYSTLGWFDDPLLSTMLNQGEITAIAYIFHELTHQKLYIQGDAEFNEAYATAVEELGIQSWLRDKKNDDRLKKYNNQIIFKQQFAKLVQDTRLNLKRIYSSSLVAEKKRTAKNNQLEIMRKNYIALKQQWPKLSNFDKWMNESINNAKLGSVAIYQELVPYFHRVFALCDNNFERFHNQVREYRHYDKEKRRDALIRATGCGASADQ